MKSPISMLSSLLILAAVALVGLLAFVATRPSTYRIERTATLPGSPDALFPWFNDLRRSTEWSPWRKFDPNATYTYDGPEAGVGASSAWTGNSRIGAGRQTIVASVPADRVDIRLEFIRPFAAVCACGFVLKPVPAGTAVTWWMSGTNNLAAKFFCLFMNQDKMIGAAFEDGFSNLKARLESDVRRS